ncbi:MAG: DNA-processing protein DprA [Myxococcaceae bacterium]|nr:DNA-processing protein DprA [Myxococcaceae bacterium]
MEEIPQRDKRALAGLWAVPGIGPKTLDDLRRQFTLSQIEDLLIGEWVKDATLPTYAAERIPHSLTLLKIGDWLLDTAAQLGMKVAWRGEPEYPERLAQIDDAPYLLFYQGPGTDVTPRRRIAMVGSRYPDSRRLEKFRGWVRETAGYGVGVISGAAFGIDTLAHTVSADAGGETWAFVGSALDQLDLHQRKLWHELQPKGATFWSELPPGVRAERKNFPRRNRLISGSADAVCVLAAAENSGTYHTIQYALDQGRPLVAPTESGNPKAELCNIIVAAGVARLLLRTEDILDVVGVTGHASKRPQPMTEPQKRVDPATLSIAAQAALMAIGGRLPTFDDLVVDLRLSSAELSAAIFELTMCGLITEYPGRRFEKV